MTATVESTTTSDQIFATPADEARLERVATALTANGFTVHLADDVAAARRLVLALIPEGAEVSQGASQTLLESGVTADLEGGRFEALRPKLRAMDRATQAREIRKLGAAPDVMVGSVSAITENGWLVAASASGSQLGPYASGAGQLVLVVGSQKVVPDLATAFERIEKHVFPLEDARMQSAYGMGSRLNKLLVMRGDFPGRTTVVLVREAVGF